MRHLLLLVFMLFMVGFIKASDSIIVKKDARLDLLTAKQAAINKKTSMMTSTGQYKGFRLQVVSTRDRQKAFDIKAELMSRFPEEKSYTIFQSPYFRVRVGNFLYREDADAFRKVLSRIYPEGVYVVADIIDYTPTEEDELLME